MKTQDEINKAAEKYAEEQNSAYTNDLYGFINGADFANGYSVEDVCGFAEWVRLNCVPSTIDKASYYYDKMGQYLSIPDLLQIYKNREK